MLKQPTRERDEQPQKFSYTVLLQVGLQSLLSRQRSGELLPHLSTLTSLSMIRLAVYFCCTFLRVASTGYYPAPCSMELGLSSSTTFRYCTCDRTTYSLYICFSYIIITCLFIRINCNLFA